MLEEASRGVSIPCTEVHIQHEWRGQYNEKAQDVALDSTSLKFCEKSSDAVRSTTRQCCNTRTRIMRSKPERKMS